MNIRPLSRDEVRQIDEIAIREYGIPGVVLMENAGAGAANAIDRLQPPGKILIVCGKGNNGGDGYVISRHLQLMGHAVEILSLVGFDQLTGDALTNYQIASNADIPMQLIEDSLLLQTSIKHSTCIIDCMLGTGAAGNLRGLYLDAVNHSNGTNVMRVAIDIPTGLDCDTGTLMPTAFKADHTITFVSTKPCMSVYSAMPFIGDIEVVSIGVPLNLLRRYTENT